MSTPKSMKKQWILLAFASLFLVASVGYRTMKGKPHTAKDACGDGCSEMGPDSPVQIEMVIKEEIDIIRALAVKLEDVNKDRNIDKHGQGVMDIVSMWLEVKRVKNQFTVDEQADEMNKNKESIQKVMGRLKAASAPISLYKGGSELMAQIGNALNALKPADNKKAKAKEGKTSCASECGSACSQ